MRFNQSAWAVRLGGICFGILVLCMSFGHGTALAEDSNPFTVRQEMRERRQALHKDAPVTITFGVAAVSGKWDTHAASHPLSSMQLEVFAKPKTSVVFGGASLLTFTNLAYFGVRQGFGKDPKTALFVEMGMAFGNAVRVTWGGPHSEISGIGPRAVLGFKKQFNDRFVLELSTGLSFALYSRWERGVGERDEETGEYQTVISHPKFAVPEVNLRIGWRLHGPKTRPEKSRIAR